MTGRRFLCQALVGVPLLLLSGLAISDDWPSRPLRIVVLSSPGSAPDRYARYYGDKLRQILGQQVIVDNKPGTGGNLAAGVVISAKDQHTLLWSITAVFAINPHVYPKTSLDARRDLVPVASMIDQGAVLVVNNDFPARTLQELVRMARERPDSLSYASYGVASVSHLVMELLSDAANIKMVHVPYKQAALVDVIGGHIPMVAEPVSTALPQIQAKKVRAIAYSGTRRLPALPDVPTFAEIYPSVGNVSGLHSMWMAADTPRAIVLKLNAAINKINDLPETKKMVGEVGNQSVSMTPEQLKAAMDSEYDRWGKFIQAKNMKLE